MDFRRSGPLDERRRRVLMDEIASPADADNPEASASGGSAKGPVRAYHEAVLSQRQPKVTDLLPVRPLWVVVSLLLGLGGIAAVEAIHVQVAALNLSPTLSYLSALDTRHRGSLDDWYASALLAAGAALAVVIFGIRSHRVDDYRGRYRIWLPTAAALLWLSLDASTGIHEAVGMALYYLVKRGPWDQISGDTLAAGCTYAWLVAYSIVFGGLGLRLLFEVWPSRVSSLALFVAAALYVTTALLQLNVIHAPPTFTAGLANSSTILLAHFALLAAIGFYARHVLLDANGRLKVHIDPDRKSKSRRAKVAKPRPAVVEQPATPAPPRPAGPMTAVAKPALPAAPHDEDEEDDESDDARYAGLSRSERRRLKKLARREQRRAA